MYANIIKIQINFKNTHKETHTRALPTNKKDVNIEISVYTAPIKNKIQNLSLYIMQCCDQSIFCPCPDLMSTVSLAKQ